MTNVNCKKFHAYFLPTLLNPANLPETAIVMTDVLRASTTMISALENGAASIWPHATIESARTAASSTENSLLCGERGGKIIDGFDCGNSPREFASEMVKGKCLVHCTTNGTVALESCRGASRVLIGSFVNLNAIVGQLSKSEVAAVLCAGTDREVTGEDVLFAGAVAAQLSRMNPDLELNDQAKIGRDHWEAVERRTGAGESLSEILGQCRGGVNLLKLGYQADVEFCAQLDWSTRVPELDQNSWRIVASC